MIEKIEATSDISFAVEIENVDGLLPKDSEINLYRILQECLNNIVKHSVASTAEVRVQRDRNSLSIMVRDNGRGFSLDPTSQGEPTRRGLGLTGIPERVRMLGGTYAIRSAPGEGTSISLRIELSDKRGAGTHEG
jgi:signal transduction histidine kinase